MMHHMSMMTIDQPPPPQSWTWSWWPLTIHHHHNHNHEHDDRRPATITTIHHMNMLTIDPPPPPQSWTWTCRPLTNHHNGQLAFQNHLFFYQKWTIAFLLNTEKAVWHCFCLKNHFVSDNWFYFKCKRYLWWTRPTAMHNFFLQWVTA